MPSTTPPPHLPRASAGNHSSRLDYDASVSTETLSLPTYDDSEVVVPAPGNAPGNWSGAASAVLVDGVFWLTYRVRRPLAEGRGVTVVVARSRDGVHFTPVTEVHRDAFGCESFERPVLIALPEGGWRLYLSCATYDSKHWWVDSLTASTVEGLADGERRLVLPGDDEVAVKDPVITVSASGEWVMWLCCHPLGDPGDEDRMTTRRLVSRDGLDWTDTGEVLAGRPGEWDARGARVAAVLTEDAAHRPVRRPPRRRVQLAREHRRRPLGRHPPGRARQRPDRVSALRRRLALRRRRAAARRPHPLLRRGRPPRRRARPGHLRPLTPVSLCP